MVNDFALQGWTLSELTDEQYRPLFNQPQKPLTKDKIVVLGPGTGLGTCLILTEGKHPRKIYTSESGHSTLPHVDFRDPVLNRIRDYMLNALKEYYAQNGQVPIVEHIVSGTGITNVYHALKSGSIPFKKEERIPSEDIEKMAQNNDPTALMTFKIFNSYLGAHAGTMAAATKTKHIFFCGGLMASPWVISQLEKTPDFLTQFTARSALTEAMKQVHFSVSLCRDMSTLGAVVRAKRLLDLESTEDAKINANRNLMSKLQALQAVLQQSGVKGIEVPMLKLSKAIQHCQVAQKGKGAYQSGIPVPPIVLPEMVRGG